MSEVDAVAPPVASPSVHEGELAVKYTFAGSADSDTFDLGVVIGTVASEKLTYVEEHHAQAVKVSRAVGTVVVRQTYQRGALLTMQTKIRNGTCFYYDKPMLLRNLVTGFAEVNCAASQLTDNEAMRAMDMTWHTSVLGMNNFMLMQRALYVAGGNAELNQPPQYREHTYPEIRADLLCYLGGRTMLALLAMPPRS